jgi:hypothetical protein
VTNLEQKGRHDVFTPRHEALVFKEPVATPARGGRRGFWPS